MIKILESKFIKSAVYNDTYPETMYAEISFCGKSNVGKSSMINTVLQRKSLAKTSSSPGKTRLINFFEIKFRDQLDREGFVNFVDLPGYGYAKVSKKERNRWKRMIEEFFQSRYQLRANILLVDSRHKADEKDIMMIRMLESVGLPFCVIATKCDKLKKSKMKNQLNKLALGLGIKPQYLIPFTSKTKMGKNDVLDWLEMVIL